VAHPWLVRGAYAVSWLYISGDVANEGYKAYLRNQRILHPENLIQARPASAEIVSQEGRNAPSVPSVTQDRNEDLKPGKVPAIEDYRTVMAERFIFQSLASMGLPAFTIHSVVRYSGRAMKNFKNVKLRTWGPIGVSISALRRRLEY
jgi:mitochondrial fission process protein 1